MYFKLAFKEKEKHRKLFIFIAIQLAITFLAGICCTSIITVQYQRYASFQPIIERDGWFLKTNLGVRTPDEDAGTGKTGREIIEKYLHKTSLICAYQVMGTFRAGDYELPVQSMAYDRELIDSIKPELAAGNWLDHEVNDEEAIEAVVSYNYDGVAVGDLLYLQTYFSEKYGEEIPVKIIGVLAKQAEIVKFKYSQEMVSSQNFVGPLTEESADEWPEQPEKLQLLIRQEDITRLSAKWEELDNIIWPNYLLFFTYHQDITAAEKAAADEFIENNFDIEIKESLPAVREKSIQYANDQILELLPIFIAVLIMMMMSTACVGVLSGKQHAKKLSLYRLIGLSQNKCLLIHFLINVFILAETTIITAIAYFVVKYQAPNVILDFGIGQLLCCLFISTVWLLFAYYIQTKILKNLDMWGRKK